MNKKKLTAVIAASTAAFGLALGGASIAMADVQPNGSDAGIYVFNNDLQSWPAVGSTVDWTADVLASPSNTDPFASLQCPADATGYATFWAPTGSEKTKSAWKVWSNLSFTDSTKTVKGADVTPSLQVSGSSASIQSAGGNFSFGVACTSANFANLASAGVWYNTAHVTAGTGNYTFDAVSTSTPTPTPTPSGSGSIAIQATTVAAQDGTLSLVVPASAQATLGTASLVNQLSTSTGTLPTFQVADQRVVSTPGWDLTASTANFVNAADATKTIDSKQLGVKPAIVSTNASGVTAGAEHVAGGSTAFGAFASAAAGGGVGTTSLNAALTLVAPVNTTAGTYNSTMTLTLVSK